MSSSEVQQPATGGEPGRRPVLSAAVEARGVLAAAEPERVWALSEAEVGGALGQLQAVEGLVARHKLALVAAASEQGLGAAGGLSSIDWVLAQAPGMSVSEAGQLQTVADAGRDYRLEGVCQAVADGVLSVAEGAQLVGFHREVASIADPGMLAADLVILLDAAPGWTARQLGVAITRTTRMLKPAKDLDAEEAKQKLARALFKTRGGCGMSSYRLVLDPEGAAILDAAVDALARPHRPTTEHDPENDGGDGDGRPEPEVDLRAPATRRADALLEVIRRGVSSPGQAPSAAKAVVVVTTTLADLVAGLHGAGVTLSDQVLSPDTVRRMACDADIIPMVLGGDGEVLDVGRKRRLVTPAIRLAAWKRDTGCTYPGCSIPAQWCDAHHGIPWWAGGDTSLLNTALLCGRHHTLVHRRDLTPIITTTGVTWHR